MNLHSDLSDGGSSPVDDGGFVGREGELGALVAGLEAALGGQGRLYLVIGEPGIGKTRLADEFAARARNREAQVLWGRCWDATGAPAYWPWVQALRSVVRSTDPPTLLEMMGPGASNIAQMLPELHTLFPDLPSLPSTDPESARFQLFDSTTLFLKTAAEIQPIVLILDDLHAADTPSLLFLQFVASQLAASRIVIVATYRDAELTPDHPLTTLASEIAREPTTHMVGLMGLEESEVAAFVEAATRNRPGPVLVSKLHRDTTGNPLFLEEAIRLLGRGGRLQDLSEAELFRVAVPERISDLINRRVQQTSERCSEALRLGAVLGVGFGFEALRRLGGFSSEELLYLLDEAVEASLLTRTAKSPARFRYSHDLVRETLYETLAQAERLILHGRAASVLEEIYGEDTDPRLAELAYHYFEAAPGGEAAKAVEYARRAGSRAAASLAYEEAARLHGMALTALELEGSSDEVLRVEVLLDLGDAETRAGDDVAAKDVFLRAASIAKRIGDASRLARAAFGYGGLFVWQRAGADRDLVPLLQDALMMLGDGNDYLRVRLLSRLACALRDSPDRQNSAALAGEAVKTARGLEDPATLCYALEGRIAATMWPENSRARLHLARELIDLAERNDQLERAMSGRLLKVGALCELGMIAEALAEVDALTRGAQRIRQPNQQFLAEIIRSLIELTQGDFERAEARLLVALDAGYANRDESFRLASPIRSSVRSQLFLLRREQGRLAEMESFVRASVSEFPWYPLHRAALVCLLAELERDGEALRLLDEISADGFSILPRDNEWLLGMALASDACALLGHKQSAGVLYEQLSPFAGRHAYGWGEGSMGAVDRYLGLLAAIQGEHTAAEWHFEEAIAVNDAMGARPWVAHSQHDYGVMLTDRGTAGDRERARDLIHSALGTATELGMTALETKIDSELSQTSAQAPAQPRSSERGVFALEGEYWSISFRGEPFRLRSTKGLQYLAQLLAAPGKEIHVLDLVGADGGRRGAVLEPGLTAAGFGDAGEALDPQAKAAYRQRLEELSEDLAEAEGWNDSERAARAREETEFLTRELARAVGLGGRDRKSGSASERARVNVTRAIKTALARVAENNSDLGRHFDTTVRTGTFCSYMPDPRAPIDWQL